MKSCISNPYWTSGCCRVLFNDVGDGQIYGRTLHLEVRNCSSSAVCSHCPLSLVSLRALVTANTFSWAGLCSCALGYGAVFGSACCFSELYQALWHTHLPGPTTKSKENTHACPVARLRVRLCPEHIGEKLLRVWRWGSWRTVGLLKTCSRAMSPALSLALKKDSKFCEHHLVRIVLNSLWIWCWRGEGRIWLEHLCWRWLVSSIGCHIAACVTPGEKGSLGGLLSLVVCTVSSRGAVRGSRRVS